MNNFIANIVGNIVPLILTWAVAMLIVFLINRFFMSKFKFTKKEKKEIAKLVSFTYRGITVVCAILVIVFIVIMSSPFGKGYTKIITSATVEAVVTDTKEDIVQVNEESTVRKENKNKVEAVEANDDAMEEASNVFSN